MPTTWRIVPAHFTADAFSGLGARLAGGRWNSPGVGMVYASEHKSLAVLEALVHADPHDPVPYTCFRLDYDESLVERLPASSLPAGWRQEPPSAATQSLGDAWIREARSAVLAVPSVLIPEELNCLLNPAHADFRRIKIGAPGDFTFDPRLLN